MNRLLYCLLGTLFVPDRFDVPALSTGSITTIPGSRRPLLLAALLLLLLRPAATFLRRASSLARAMKESPGSRPQADTARNLAVSLDVQSSDRLLREVPARVAAALKLEAREPHVALSAGREALRLDRPEHFEADAITTARRLLGARLVRVLPDGRRLSGIIVECESYLGVHDAAAHSFQAKRTARNEAMYKAGGTACTWGVVASDPLIHPQRAQHVPMNPYTPQTDVYQCHRYFCMNVICGLEVSIFWGGVCLAGLPASMARARLHKARTLPDPLSAG